MDNDNNTPEFTTEDMTAQVLHDMLKENTGVHMLDSGMSCGRHWQRNQARDFDNEPETTITGRWDYVEVTHNVYHWLKNRLTYNEELDQRFRDYAHRDDDYYFQSESWLQCAEGFLEILGKEHEEEYGHGLGGIYGEGEPFCVNTYNEEELLSQILQFYYWEDEDGEHVLLQIHGGADVRGGYTRPVAFDVSGPMASEICMFDFGKAHVYCTNEHPTAVQLRIDGDEDGGDCGNYWVLYGSSVEDSNTKSDLDKLVKYDADPEDTPDGEPPAPGRGYAFVDEDGNIHCPDCGSVLAASPY